MVDVSSKKNKLNYLDECINHFDGHIFGYRFKHHEIQPILTVSVVVQQMKRAIVTFAQFLGDVPSMK